MDDLARPREPEETSELSRRGFNALSVAAGLAIAGSAAAEASVVETDVDVKTPDGVADAALFHLAGKPAPAVLMWTDIFGLRPAFRDMGRRLAAEGYTVLVPNPFYRLGRAPMPKEPINFADPASRAKIGELTGPLTADAVSRDANAFVSFLDAQPSVNRKAKAGVVGYCMGGPFTLRTAAARADRIGAGCSFHGGNLVNDTPDSPHLLASKIKASFYFGIATNDDQRQPDAKDKLRAAFDAAHVPATIEVYAGCNHGWCVADGQAYNKDGAERAWGNMEKLYKAQLV
jgi:carboxymethylenebutenolidase